MGNEVVGRISANEIEDVIRGKASHFGYILCAWHAEITGHALTVKVCRLTKNAPARNVADNAQIYATVRCGVGKHLVDAPRCLRRIEFLVLQKRAANQSSHRVGDEIDTKIFRCDTIHEAAVGILRADLVPNPGNKVAQTNRELFDWLHFIVPKGFRRAVVVTVDDEAAVGNVATRGARIDDLIHACVIDIIVFMLGKEPHQRRFEVEALQGAVVQTTSFGRPDIETHEWVRNRLLDFGHSGGETADIDYRMEGVMFVHRECWLISRTCGPSCACCQEQTSPSSMNNPDE